MSNQYKKNLFLGIGLGFFVFAPCFWVLLYQRGYKTPDTPKEIAPRMLDTVIYGKEDPVGGNPSFYERLMSYNLLGGNQDPEEAQAEADAEAERLANWKASFPYQPTTDPDVRITEEMLNPRNRGEHPVRNHVFLRGFFENESRFTAQFEQLYHILEEHERGDNPVAAGNIFNNLWRYHQCLQKDPKELSSTYSYRMGRYCTNAEVAESLRESIVYDLHAERRWPDREFMPEDEAMSLRDRIIDEIQGMDEISQPHFAFHHNYGRELEVGDSPLVIRPGWQAAYDEWDRRWDEIESRGRQNRVVSVGDGNVLLANDQPVISAEGDGFFANITTPDGYRLPLRRGDNGEVIIPTPAEIEEMKANGEGEWVVPPEPSAPRPPQLTEEEWKMQEVLRQLEEAASRQQ